ncbi:ATP-binding protein [Hyphomonas sp.]|uniref:ATP-binding protein n=1 Tax=Hyphomonas sp. TaxID=87 RepID=UPI000DFA031F|nr:ATP-binding protein [Hyphomonas sp.]RCL88450.1 MAG: histidine kinase [Hyphomonas sp.]
MSVHKKEFLTTVDGTPKKRMFLSIISDYDLKTGLCELVDNAIDHWMSGDMASSLRVDVTLDADRQYIQVKDNAGGVGEDDADLLVSPGASRSEFGDARIGIFGVGGKRAAIALGEMVEIRTRKGAKKTVQIDLTNDWIESPSWELQIFRVPNISKSTTIVEISRVRQGFEHADIISIFQHLSESYGWFIENGCEIYLNGDPIPPAKFDSWSYPPDYLPKLVEFEVEPVLGEKLSVRITGGLISDRDPEEDNYGVYFYCNNRLILKQHKSREVGYFVSNEAGVPHPDASLCRVIVEYNGPSDLMPWNSSKSGVNFSHPAFVAIRTRIIDFTGFFSKVSRRHKNDRDETIFPFTSGSIEVLDSEEAASSKKKVLPKPPSTRMPNRYEQIKLKNAKILSDSPWTVGLVEALGLTDVLGKQSAFKTRNRANLILLDSNFEIALKEFIVSRKDLFKPHEYTDTKLSSLFKNRTMVMNEVLKHVTLMPAEKSKIGYYYNIRNNLIHQRATVSVSDDEIADYRKIIESVLNKLFGLKFPK